MLLRLRAYPEQHHSFVQNFAQYVDAIRATFVG